MKKRTKIFLAIFLSILTIIGIFIPIMPFILKWNPTYGEPALEFPFENPDDIIKLRGYNLIEYDGAYAGDPHSGIDLQIGINGSKVISPCTGTVGIITSSVNKNKGHIMISINIRINWKWSIMLVFEPYSNSTEFHEYQMSLLKVKFGQKVQIGDEIGTLLIGGDFPHIHYTVRSYFGHVCPYDHSSNTAQIIFDEIAVRTNSTICYP
ncbi:MAG: M23 family metallopeptidase [Asgard group archaeon]|nr:M23 family metallopeptidase [Asgard group archaeon]